MTTQLTVCRFFIVLALYLCSVPAFFFTLYMWPEMNLHGAYPKDSFVEDLLAAMLFALAPVMVPFFTFFLKSKTHQ